METTMAPARRFRRQPLAALGKLTVAALIGIVLVFTYVQVGIFGFVPPLALFELVILIAAGVVAAGWRWAPLLGTLVSALLLILDGPPLLETLQAPAVQGQVFGVSAVTLALLVVGIGAGIGATAQNYRRAAGDRHTPRGLVAALIGLAGLLVGALLVAAVPYPGIGTSTTPQTLEGLPALAAKGWMFDRADIHAKVGEVVALRLTNGDSEAHYLDIDELGLHAPIPAGKTSLAVFKPTAPGTYIFYCHPHADKAAMQGMVGKLIVEP
jgi:plastocyanin